MKLPHRPVRLSVLLLAALLSGPVPAGAQLIKSRKSRKIEQENKRLKQELDSLKQLVDTLLPPEYRDSSDRTSVLLPVRPEIWNNTGKAAGTGTEATAGAALGGAAAEAMAEEAAEGARAADSAGYTPQITDSLLQVWYLHRQANRTEEREYDMDSVHFSSHIPDSVYLRRLAGLNSPISLPYNETVRNYMILYSEKMPAKMSEMLGLSEYYFPIFQEILNRYEMPEELKYLAVIESALNPMAISRAEAKGMWQFMYGTAKSYGLKINSFVDERLDPVKSADAAARYLKDAYDVFGDWNLAIASYNCGSGNVSKAIRRCGSKSDFWAVYDFLPRETRGYVPAFVGAMYAFKYRREYGLSSQSPLTPVHIDTFHIHRNLHFQQIADLVGISAETLRGLNPQYIHNLIPGREETCVLRLPSRYVGRFIEQEDSLYTHRAKEFLNPATIEQIKRNGEGFGQKRVVYKVRKGDCLGTIARRNHVTISQIKRWNRLRGTRLRIGQRLVLYKPAAPPKISLTDS